jgi:hypothetical protein
MDEIHYKKELRVMKGIGRLLWQNYIHVDERDRQITIKQSPSLHSLAPVSNHQEKHHMLFHNPKDTKIKNMKNDLSQKISTNLQ